MLRAAGIGSGFAIFVAVILGAVVWWSSRPPRPKPWNTKNIAATYDGLSVDEGNLAIYYALTNNTDEDFKVASDDGVHLGAELKDPKGAMAFTGKTRSDINYPLYIPAHRTVRFEFKLVFLQPSVGEEGDSEDERLDYGTKLAQFAKAKLPNVEHFFVMDDATRDEIDLPQGWEKRAKEPFRVKRSDTPK